MSKHKHAEMIKAKADNMDLVVFIKRDDDLPWYEIVDDWDISFLVGKNSYHFFLCLPQHKEACLHWLNGGSVSYPGENHSLDYYEYDQKESVNWSTETIFMEDIKPEIKIKPRKEKRWIALDSEGYVMPMHCGSKDSARDHAANTVRLIKGSTQFIEIEVEV